MDWYRIKYFLFQKKHAFFKFHRTLFEWALIIGAIYFVTVVRIEALIQMIVLLIAVVTHEIAHAYVAYYYGDSTAKQQGRLSLNPLVHIDPLGSIILPFLFFISGSSFMIGWAKPVPVDTSYFKEPVKEMMWVALAGPLINFTWAILASFLLKVASVIGLESLVIFYFLKMMIILNLVLAIFNLIPIPPLDGSRILMYFLPKEGQSILMRLEPFGFFLILGVLFLGGFSFVISFFLPPLLRVLL